MVIQDQSEHILSQTHKLNQIPNYLSIVFETLLINNQMHIDILNKINEQDFHNNLDSFYKILGLTIKY